MKPPARGECQVFARHDARSSGPVPNDRKGAVVSTRVRILPLVLLTTLAVLAAAALAAGRTITPRGAPAWSSSLREPRLPAQSWRTAGQSGLEIFGEAIGFGSALVGSAPVGNGPSTLAINRDTHTIYVANGNNDAGGSAGGNTVSVIDARHCHAQDVSRCKGPWPTITVGNLPSGIAIDKRTDTVYVTNFDDDTVSVFNGATCNAIVSSGCGQIAREGPGGVAADPDLRRPGQPHRVRRELRRLLRSQHHRLDDRQRTCNATDLTACPTTAAPDRRRRSNATRYRRRPGHPHRVRDHDRRAERVVCVRREHLQRDRAIGMRLDRPPHRRSRRPERRQGRPGQRTPCTRPTSTTPCRRSTCATATPRPGRLRHPDARDRHAVPRVRLRARLCGSRSTPPTTPSTSSTRRTTHCS